MNTYDIHGLVGIEVDDAISPQLLGSLDFQLNAFRTDRASAEKTIKISAYQERPPAKDSRRFYSDFHTACAYDSPADHFYLRRSGKGLELGTDGAGFLITPFLQLLLLESGLSFVHAAGCVGADGSPGILLAGPGGVGKTAVVGELLGRQGWRMLGDDLVIVSVDGRALSFPRSLVLKEYHRDAFPDQFRTSPKTRARRLRNRLTASLVQNAPFKGAIKGLLRRAGRYEGVVARLPHTDDARAVPVEEVFGPEAVAGSARIDLLVYLSRHTGKDFQIEDIDPVRMSKRMWATIQSEWWTSYKILTRLAATELVDLEDFLSRSSDVLLRAASQSRCMEICVPEEARPAELADRILQL